MGTRKDKVLLNILLGTGVYLLDSWRNRMGGTVDELRSRAQDTYETAADRVSRATDVIRGEDSHSPGHGRGGAVGTWYRHRRRSAAGSRQWRRDAQQHRQQGPRHSRSCFLARGAAATGTFGGIEPGPRSQRSDLGLEGCLLF